MLRGMIVGALATVVAAILIAYLAVVSGMIPANADGQPLPLEVLGGVHVVGRRPSIAWLPKGPNPVALTDANLIAGIDLYCNQLRLLPRDVERAPAAATSVAKGEYPQPPQLATDGVEDDPEGLSRSGRSSTASV